MNRASGSRDRNENLSPTLLLSLRKDRAASVPSANDGGTLKDTETLRAGTEAGNGT